MRTTEWNDLLVTCMQMGSYDYVGNAILFTAVNLRYLHVLNFRSNRQFSIFL